MSFILPEERQIAAIVPSYSIHGDCSVIIRVDGCQSSVKKHVRTLIQKLARKHSTDLAALRANTAKLTNRSIWQPLAFTPELILIPLKVRKPKIAGDTSTGYVNMYTVENIERSQAHPYRCSLTLRGGTRLPVVWSAATVRKQLHCARLLCSCLPLNVLRHHTASHTALSSIAVKIIDLMYDLLNLKKH